MKPSYRSAPIFFAIISVLAPLAAQDNTPPSLGELARQEKARREQQPAAGTQADADARELTGLTEAKFKANILIDESHAATEKWVLMPAADRQGAGRLRQLAVGKKYYLPFVVTGYPWPATETMDLTAHVRLISPSGKISFGAARFAEALGPDPKSPSVIVLNPVMDITFNSSDPIGTYAIRVTVIDHIHSVYSKAEEQFQLVPEAGTQSKAEK